MEITAADLNALADKIDGLDLTDGERAILDAVVERATADEVGGFDFSLNFEEIKVTLKGGTPRTPTAQKFLDIFTELS